MGQPGPRGAGEREGRRTLLLEQTARLVASDRRGASKLASRAPCKNSSSFLLTIATLGLIPAVYPIARTACMLQRALQARTKAASTAHKR